VIINRSATVRPILERWREQEDEAWEEFVRKLSLSQEGRKSRTLPRQLQLRQEDSIGSGKYGLRHSVFRNQGGQGVAAAA